MKNCKFFIVVFFVICIGCSGIVQGMRISITGFTPEQKKEEFVNSFGSWLKDEKYNVKIIGSNERGNEENVVKDGYGIYPILLEATKESFSITSTVRICEDKSEQVFVQIVQCSFFSERKADFEAVCKKIKNSMQANYPHLKAGVYMRE